MDHPEPGEFNVLLSGYLRESLNPQELAIFFELAARPENIELVAQSFGKDLDGDMADLSSAREGQESRIRLLAQLEASPRPVRKMFVTLRWVAVLACLFTAAMAVYLFNHLKNRTEFVQTKSDLKTPAWLAPDHIGATLFLTGGDSMTLDNQDKGVIAKQDGIEVIQSGGVIRYSGMSQSLMYNEIRTGKGKLWRVVLPDQTVVWLNGNSSIKYPLQFNSDSRSVEMTGEAYFEVVHNAANQFLVHIPSTVNPAHAGSTIQDLGTSFNIRSYADDSDLTTTLIEGSVMVKLDSQQTTLNAGQQSLVSIGKNEIRVVQNANLAEALAWKNGFFYFNNSPLPVVMNQLSDWYHVSVVFKGRPTRELFKGQIDKTLALSEVLKGLQQPGVIFSLDSDHQITVIQQ